MARVPIISGGWTRIPQGTASDRRLCHRINRKFVVALKGNGPVTHPCLIRFSTVCRARGRDESATSFLDDTLPHFSARSFYFSMSWTREKKRSKRYSTFPRGSMYNISIQKEVPFSFLRPGGVGSTGTITVVPPEQHRMTTMRRQKISLSFVFQLKTIKQGNRREEVLH